MAYKLEIKELVKALVLAPIGGAIGGYLGYLIAFDSSKLPASPFPSSSALYWGLIIGILIAFGIIWERLDKFLVQE